MLVFALSQGIFWAGVASTFVMALGTAMTVAVLAALAVGAKGFARRLARGDDRRAGQVMLGLELAAALFITAARRGALRRLALRLTDCRQLDRLAVRRALRRLAPGFLRSRSAARAATCLSAEDVLERGKPGVPIGFRVGGIVRGRASRPAAPSVSDHSRPGEDAALVERDRQREGARRPGRGKDRAVGIARDRGDVVERARALQARSR